MGVTTGPAVLNLSEFHAFHVLYLMYLVRAGCRVFPPSGPGRKQYGLFSCRRCARACWAAANISPPEKNKSTPNSFLLGFSTDSLIYRPHGEKKRAKSRAYLFSPIAWSNSSTRNKNLPNGQNSRLPGTDFCPLFQCGYSLHNRCVLAKFSSGEICAIN